MSLPQAPWQSFRGTAEALAEAARAELERAVGTKVSLGKLQACNPDLMLADRRFPMQAYVVSFDEPLRDLAIFLTSQREDKARPLIERAARALHLAARASDDESGDAPSYSIAEPVPLDDLPQALEQCDALYLEASVGIEMPAIEFKLVLGSGLLESANILLPGTPDTAGRTGQAGVSPHASSHVAASTPSIDELDAELAAQEQAAVSQSHSMATSRTAASTPPSPESTLRWTQLLSGVEVELVAELGHAHLALSEITTLAPERVLTLEQLVDEPVAVLVNGMRYATGRLVVVDGEYGVEIIEIVDQGALASSLAA